MTLPGSVFILGRQLTVVEKDVVTGEDGKPAGGGYLPAERTIEISKGEAPFNRFVALWHESLHHAITFNLAGLSDEEQETIVTWAAEVVCDILEKNERMRQPPSWRWG